MKQEVFPALITASVFLLIHLFTNRLRFIYALPRSKWLSVAGGSSIAYVFVHLLPELSQMQLQFREKGPLDFLHHHIYLISLIGLGTFYSLEKYAKTSGKAAKKKDTSLNSGNKIFYIHIISFAIYNAFIGYTLLYRVNEGLIDFALYSVAIGLHFTVNDFGLYQHHKEQYLVTGRWLVSLAIVVGFIASVFYELPQTLLAIIFAFLVGGIILNILKEELPEESESSFPAFWTGIIVYSALMVLFD